MKTICLAVLCLLLTGCSVPVWETVDDIQPAEQVRVWQEEAYTLQFGVPEGTSLVAQENGYALYSTDNGELEIETRTFLTTGVETAVETLSGFSSDQLTILQTTRFGMPEYQVAGVSQTDPGARLYRADLVLDGSCCYAVVASSLEGAGDYYAFQARQVFSTFGLSENEGV